MLLEKVVASPNIPHNSWTIRLDKFPGDRVLSSLTINRVYPAIRRVSSLKVSLRCFTFHINIFFFFFFLYVWPMKRFTFR